MAKVSMVNRQIKRERLVKKFMKKREELKKISKDSTLSNEERFKARLAQLSCQEIQVRQDCITGVP